MNFYQLQNERWCYSFNHKGIVGEKKKQNKTKKTLSTEFFCNKRNPPHPNERSRHNFHFCFVFQLRPVIIPPWGSASPSPFLIGSQLFYRPSL